MPCKDQNVATLVNALIDSDTVHNQRQTQLLRVPGEVLNRIYAHALEGGNITVPTGLSYTNSLSSDKLHESTDHQSLVTHKRAVIATNGSFPSIRQL